MVETHGNGFNIYGRSPTQDIQVYSRADKTIGVGSKGRGHAIELELNEALPVSDVTLDRGDGGWIHRADVIQRHRRLFGIQDWIHEWGVQGAIDDVLVSSPIRPRHQRRRQHPLYSRIANGG